MAVLHADADVYVVEHPLGQALAVHFLQYVPADKLQFAPKVHPFEPAHVPVPQLATFNTQPESQVDGSHLPFRNV